MHVVPYLFIFGCLVLVVFFLYARWQLEADSGKFWKREHDKEFAARLETIEDRDNLRRANAKLQGKLTRLREALADDAPTP